MKYQAVPPTVARSHLRYNPYAPAVHYSVPVPKAVHTSQQVDADTLRDAMKAVASAEAGEGGKVGKVFFRTQRTSTTQ